MIDWPVEINWEKKALGKEYNLIALTPIKRRQNEKRCLGGTCKLKLKIED